MGIDVDAVTLMRTVLKIVERAGSGM